MGEKEKGEIEKSFKNKNLKITCPRCYNEYDQNLRKCPNCGRYNPIYDFPFLEFVINISIASILILVVIGIISAMVKMDPTRLYSILPTSVGIVVSVIFNTILILIFFYIGGFVRDLIVK